MHVRPWFSGWVDANRYGQKVFRLYMFRKLYSTGFLGVNQAHWHNFVDSHARRQLFIWCTCGANFRHLLEPLNIEPLTARARVVLNKAKALLLLQAA